MNIKYDLEELNRIAPTPKIIAPMEYESRGLKNAATIIAIPAIPRAMPIAPRSS
jgi:hypothetical protein